jgi:hypothetical protein
MNRLARFDGLHFRGIAKDGPPELQGNIGGLEPDSGDGLWIVTATGLLHYSSPTISSDSAKRTVALPPSRPLREAIAHGRDGEMWIYGDGKLARSHNGVLENRELPAEALPLRDIAESADRVLWIADGEAVFAMHGNAKPVRYPLPGARMLYAEDFGDVFAGDGHRLFRFDGSVFTQVSDPGLV